MNVFVWNWKGFSLRNFKNLRRKTKDFFLLLLPAFILWKGNGSDCLKKKPRNSKLLNILTMSSYYTRKFDSIVTQSSIWSITYLWCVAWSARESFLSHFYELFMVISYYDESFSSFYDNFSLLVFCFCFFFDASVPLKLCYVVLAE